ncbi:helix-turn-helix transcriptional regulator [Corynebacterium sp. J010B-136]|uniref:helix-turn-helix transcriptional regulator n=1 Tax=Corynebacterium sp. J010B-136 TaxID=2099401 RepID=UPI000CFA1485|nr:helix-turn-helix transcriptional regulator [Corynebacterium sp. J010B-136]PQM75233.1 hypothetical protein C5Y44_00150 [Corynebacterium sp. J010B-136]
MSGRQQAEMKEHAKEILREQREFRNSLVKIREQRNLSQQQVGEALGLSQSAIAQFERYDSNPTLGTIRRYALAVGASIVMSATPRDKAFVLPTRQPDVSASLVKKSRLTSVDAARKNSSWQPTIGKVEYA